MAFSQIFSALRQREGLSQKRDRAAAVGDAAGCFAVGARRNDAKSGNIAAHFKRVSRFDQYAPWKPANACVPKLRHAAYGRLCDRHKSGRRAEREILQVVLYGWRIYIRVHDGGNDRMLRAAYAGQRLGKRSGVPCIHGAPFAHVGTMEAGA